MSGNHEKQMSATERHEAAGVPARRARASAWTVFWLTAGTSVLYNCYHALVGDHMPWYTGVPLGVLPLAVAIGVLEFSGAWRENKTLQVAAWSVTGGAMAWSAIAINAVVHHGWAFGLIGDTAALAAMYFLLNGPTAGQAVAAVIRTETELLARIAAGQSARERQAAEHEAAVTALRDRARGEMNALTARRDADVSALREELTGELETRDRALADAETALASARSEAESATARADRLERKLTGPAGRSSAGAARSRTAPRTAPANSGGTAPDDDLELESKALKLLATDLDMSGAELARQLGVSEGYGRKLRRRLSGDRPSEGESDRPENRAGTAPGDRGEDRA